MRRLTNLATALALPLLASCGNGATEPQNTVVDAALVVQPATGTVLTDFVFDAGSSTATTRTIRFRWDWESDGQWDTPFSSEARATRRFETSTARVTVEAQSGNGSDQSSATVTLNLQHGEIIGSLHVLENITPKDLAWDGQHFWILGSRSGLDSIFRVHSAYGLVMSSIGPPVSWPGALAFDGSDLWVTDNTIPGEHSRLFQVDPATGLPHGSFPVEFTNRASGLDFRDGVFFHGAALGNTAGDNRIHEYDADGNELLSLGAPEETEGPRGLAFDGVDLWVTGYGSEKVFVVDATTGAVERSLDLPGNLGKPLLVNGYLWLPYLEQEGDDTAFYLKKIVP